MSTTALAPSALPGKPATFAAKAIEGSVLYRCLEEMHSRILTLGLADIDDDNIQFRKHSWLREWLEGTYDAPGIVLCPFGREQPVGGTNRRDDIGYPIAVVMFQRSNETTRRQDLTTNMDRILMWRQKIRRRFINQRLNDVPEVLTIRFEPDLILGHEWFKQGWDVSGIIFRVIAREVRG